MEVEAQEMSHLAMKASDMSCYATMVAQRSRRAFDVANWCDHAAEATEMSSRTAAAWENVLWAGEDSYRRMHAIVHSQMDQISGWARL